MDTIYALSSGIGRVAVAVVRVTGPSSGDVLRSFTLQLPQERVATLRTLRDPSTGRIIDKALVLWFPGPNSFTGEDIVEFQVHGGLAVIQAVFSSLQLLGCRPAKPGEFTQRAFANGKIGLTEIEGLADLIEAETEAQRDVAIRLTLGALQTRVLSWRTDLIAMLALIESNIDFVEEGDVPALILGDILSRVSKLRSEFETCLRDGESGKKLRDGFKIAIAGAPNAGKSTLLNAFANRDVAIVSDIPGTTRDVLEVHLDIKGLPITFIDTAGLRESVDPIEVEGIRRAREQFSGADLILCLSPINLDRGDSDPIFSDSRSLLVRTKADLTKNTGHGDLVVSAKTGAGFEELLNKIYELAHNMLLTREPPLLNRDRHLDCVRRATKHLSSFTTDTTLPIEIMAEQLMRTTRELESLIGLVNVDDVLDDLFSRFCIGK